MKFKGSVMHPEKYNLNWHTYSDHLKNMMKELMMDGGFSDVTIVTEDKKKIKAHMSILSACSPVFKDILQRGKNSSHIMYLRGIQYSEMESILQFIYLGEATFYEERIQEFLAVAKSLEIKELCNAKPESNDEPDDEPSPNDQDTPTESVEEKTVISEQMNRQASKEKQSRVECDQCNKTYFDHSGLRHHKKSAHQGVRYACDQCDFQGTQQGSVTKHIQSMHEGIKYACNHCDYQATQQSHLTVHIQSKHEGVKHACNQCDYQATTKGNLKAHIQSKHKGASKSDILKH